MKLRSYVAAKDYQIIKNWITDERMHDLWCAKRIPYPMTEEFIRELADLYNKYGIDSKLNMRDFLLAEMSYNFPSLFLFITKLFDVWSFSEFLQVIRFIIIPCYKIICISRFIGNIPE